MKFPDYIGIGTRRCASSWLHEALYSHPEIGKPRRGLHFFSENRDKKLEWYLNELKPYTDKKVLIEYSVTYMYPEYCDLVAKTIYDINPDTNIFVVLRNPVLRAYSDYLRSIRMGEINKNITFKDAIKQNNLLIKRSRYKNLLQSYYDYFGDNKIKIFIYEDIVKNNSSFLSEVFEYLGVNNTKNDGMLRFEKEGKSIKHNSIYKTIKYTNKTITSIFDIIGFTLLWSRFKRKFLKYYLSLIEITLRSHKIKQTDFDELVLIFENDIKFIESKINRKLSFWRSPI